MVAPTARLSRLLLTILALVALHFTTQTAQAAGGSPLHRTGPRGSNFPDPNIKHVLRGWPTSSSAM